MKWTWSFLYNFWKYRRLFEEVSLCNNKTAPASMNKLIMDGKMWSP